MGNTYIYFGYLFPFFRKEVSKNNEYEKKVSYTDILIQLPQIIWNNFVKHYQQAFQYESKIYLDTTYWTNIMLM